MKDKKNGVLLDLDGTLWDSSVSVAEAWSEKLKLMGMDQRVTTEQIQSIMGLPMDEIAQIIFAGSPADQRIPLMEACSEYENEYISRHGGKLYPHLMETLQKLHEDYFTAIVSNCQKGYIEAFIQYYHLEPYIDDIESYGNTLLYKDENIRLVVNRNHLDKAVYVGDIDKDRQASVKAGVPFIFASYGMGEVENTPRIDSLSQLPKRVKEVFEEAAR